MCKYYTAKPTSLELLPIPDFLNVRIHVDLFGLMLLADRNNKYILYINVPFIKYAVVLSIPNKEADTVTIQWFCKFGIQMEEKNSS